MAIEDKAEVMGILSGITRPKKPMWFQETIDPRATPENERRLFRSGEHDDLVDKWLGVTGSIGVSDHTQLDVIQRLGDLLHTRTGSLCLSCHPGRGITEWDRWTDDLDQRVIHYQGYVPWKQKLALCKRIFINFEVTRKVPGNAKRESVVTLFLTQIIEAIRDASPGCQVVVYNEAMWYGNSVAWHLPNRPLGDFRCISGFPGEVGIQRDFIDEADRRSIEDPATRRQYILCVWPEAYFYRPRYFEPVKRWSPKVQIAWNDEHPASLRYFHDIGVLVRNDSRCSAVLVHRSDLFDPRHAERYAELARGMTDG